ncbi:transporter substrate-binding domain-containing protein [Ideonella sp. A 288]|uniref:transporter substrate-binding domain-containing protein n=1 Tax=Ideonella sp. A 288 TaxID=1962181 RepID=UPI0013032CDE|nr:transporter substrate-binding domain-containing protein [Ideonella sp. A 288]
MLAASVLAWADAAGAVEYRFRSPTTAAAALPLNTRVLTEAERQFIAGLPELRVGVPTPPAQPYEMVASDGQVSGIHPEMLVALARTFGLRLTPVVLPDWSSVLQAARERRVDIVMTLGVTTERLEYLAFTIGATPLPGALFARRGAEIDPSHASFALERNYLAVDHVRRQYPEASILTVETTADALRAVADGRADAYLGSLLEASDWLAREPQPGIELNRLVSYGTGYYHFGVRKDWAPLATILNKGIQSLRSSTGRDLAAALGASLPAGTVLSQPLALPEAEAALLAQRPVWRVGAVRGLTLLNDIDVNGLHSGIGAEYAEQVARRLGVAMQPVAFGSVAAMLDALRRGELDLVPFLTRTPEREKDFQYSAPYVEMPYMLVARSDGPLYWNLDSLRGRRLALPPQHPLRGLLARDYPDIRIVDSASGNDAMDRVARREADAAVEVKLFANLRINADNDGSLRTVAEVYELPAQFHLATARGGPSLMPLVERALADIPADERQRMLRRWVAVDLRPGFPWRRHLPLLAVSAAALLALAGGTAWWMRRLSREVRARRRSEALLNDIATTVPGVAFRYVIEPDGSLRQNYFTPGAKAFLGIDLDPKHTVLGSLGPRLRPEHRAAALAEQEASLRTGRRFKTTGAYRHPDGRERWLHAEAVRAMRPDGRAVWTGYIVDVSTERELQERLEREADARHLMLASASHELRAPTHTLSLALQALGTEGLEGDQQQALRIARESARTLTQLLDDVLDSARLDQQALGLHPRTVDLPALLSEVCDAWRAAARDKGLDFVLEIAPEVPAQAELDPLRVKQVLTNLLSNACKYTAAGRVGLRVEVVHGASTVDGPRLRMVVDDTGVGIDAQAQARLFEPFATVDDPAQPSTTAPSSGLGLSICRRLASMMGGSITLDSERGRGTRMSFELPLRQPMPMGETPALRPEGSLVVVCDDDATSRLLLAHMLRRQGLEVAETGQGDEALALWRRGGVRAIVTDLDMPGMNGPALLRQVRAEETGRGERTVLIVCSGSLAEFGDDVPAPPPHDAMLLKPVDVSALVETLRRLGVTAAHPAPG